ncbi:DDE-1 domain containing protein [Curvularia clavata]|uniref:DDE-1 domain containing protein n=1 Tax=Curvularia clavata TaxID=95742 RepID=A0A9Q9DQ60_CURCL|nr:DDE-1 domain containing protein [Curvularia clavata]
MEDLSGKAPRLGRNWISRWLRDNPDYRRKKQKKQELNRVAANTQGDTYNMDETGFRLGVGGSQWVITTGIDAVQSGSDTNRDFCTAIETISGDGVVLPPFLVLKGSAHLEKWYKNTSLPASYAVTSTSTAGAGVAKQACGGC